MFFVGAQLCKREMSGPFSLDIPFASLGHRGKQLTNCTMEMDAERIDLFHKGEKVFNTLKWEKITGVDVCYIL